MLNKWLAHLLGLPILIIGALSATEPVKTSLNIFLECGRCDMDFVRQEIPYVVYVRDRQDADIHIFQTIQRTGSGGSEFTLTFIGREQFIGQNDTLRFMTGPEDTADKMRQERVRILRIGLVQYLLTTPLADKIDVQVLQETEAISQPVDKWHNWVFNLRGNSFFNAQKSYQSLSLYGTISANHITEEWKLLISFNGNYNEDAYEYGGEEYLSTSKGRRFSISIIKSLTDHTSIGIWSEGWISSVNNTDLALSLTPKFEYNFYPYSESTRRQLRLIYAVGISQYKYLEETIYLKTEETLWDEGLSLSLETVKPWGTVNISIEGNHYFHDFSKNILSLNTMLSLRLVKGLSLNLFGSSAMVHNQLSIPLGDYSIEDVLLKRAELETQFSYFASVGFSYSFGSIYNNIVNPRFGSGGNRYSFSFSF